VVKHRAAPVLVAAPPEAEAVRLWAVLVGMFLPAVLAVREWLAPVALEETAAARPKGDRERRS